MVSNVADASVDAAQVECSPAQAPMARRTGPPALRPLTIGLAATLLVGSTALFFGVFAFGLSGLQEQRSQHQLYATFRGLLSPSSPVAPAIGGRIPQGTPVALLNAPAAGMVNQVVVEGTSSADLLAGPGHLPDSPLPGQSGESVLLGKSLTAGAPFAGLTKLRPGDKISVRTGQGDFHYVVAGRVAAGGRLPKITTAEGLLTLVSAGASGGLDDLAPGHLVYVVAKLQGKVVPAPFGRPRGVGQDQLQGHGDPGAWPLVAVWFAALAAASAACWWVWRRSGMLRTWLVGAPILLALMWGFSDAALRLLPNVY